MYKKVSWNKQGCQKEAAAVLRRLLWVVENDTGHQDKPARS